MKTIMFDDREIQFLTAIVIDKDKEEALKFLTNVSWERVKDKDSKACGPKAVGIDDFAEAVLYDERGIYSLQPSQRGRRECVGGEPGDGRRFVSTPGPPELNSILDTEEME